MWLNEETRIAQVLILTSSDGFTSPPKDVVINTFSFLKVELSKLIGERKSLTLEPATLRLEASTLTSRPLEPQLTLNNKQF